MTTKITITGTNEKGETIHETFDVDDYNTFFSQSTYATIGDDTLSMRIRMYRRHWIVRLWRKIFKDEETRA